MRGLKPEDGRRTTEAGGPIRIAPLAFCSGFRRLLSVVCLVFLAPLSFCSVVRRLSSVVALLSLAAASGVAGEIEYQPSYEAAAAAAKASHQLVMIVVVGPGQDKDGRDVCKLLREEVLPNEPIAKLIRKCFAPVLVDAAEIKAGKQQPPAVLNGQGEIPLPTVFFFDADGKMAGKIVGYAPAQSYISQIKAIADKVAAVAPTKDARDAERALKRGREAVDRKDFKGALDALTAALAGGLAGDEKDQAKRMLDEIQGTATAKFQEGGALEGEHKIGSAIRAYRECAWQFPATEAAAKATQRLEELAKDTELRKKLREYRAAKLMAQATAAYDKGSYGSAVAAVDQILKDFGDTAPVEEAKKLRARLDANPKAATGAEDDRVRAEAERLLHMAETFRHNNMPAKALAEYQKILDKFPKTRYAATAQEKIKEITEESK